MTSTTTLRRLTHARVCHLVLFDGIETAYTDNSILSFGDYTGHGHTIKIGLDLKGAEFEEALDIRSGRLDDTTGTVRIFDYDGTLAQLFAAEDPSEEPLGLSIYPGDDLTLRTEVHSKHIGTEFIGPNGNRHRYPAILGFQVGDMHIGQDQELPHHRPAPVSNNPVVWRGRRMALYRVYIDHDGTRRPLGESDRIWWGIVLDQGTVDGRHWSIECAGPQSWLQRDLGILTQREPVDAFGEITLNTTAGEDETGMHVDLRRGAQQQATHGEYYGVRSWDGSISATNVAEIIDDIRAELATASTTAGADGTFDGTDNRWVEIDDHGRIKIHSDEDTNHVTWATLRLTLHHKVWAALGFDTVAQQELPEDDPKHSRFVDFNGNGAPGAGYRTGIFECRDTGNPSQGENGGVPKVFVPLYEGGTTTLLADLNNGRGQVVDLGNGFGDNIIYHRGQLSRPVASDPDDPTSPYNIPGGGGDVNRQGLWLFYGKRRRANEDEYDEYWVGRGSWRGGSVNQQGQMVGGKLVITQWHNPREFGFDRPMPSGDWTARTNAADEYRIKAVPLLGLDYYPSAQEEAHVVIERLLRSTGTSTGWSSYSLDPAATLDAGDNNSAGMPHRDAEVADLGLGIPTSMVQSIVHFGLEGAALPDNLGRVKVVIAPGTPADMVLEGLMRPFGWCWSLRGGAYGILSPYRTPAPDQVDVVLDPSTKLGSFEPYYRSYFEQELRALAPIDEFELEYAYDPINKRYNRNASTDSKDLGRRYRPGGILEKHRSQGIRYPSGWATRMREIGSWWARRHFFVSGWPYIGREPVHVGQFVRLTDPRGFDPRGVYGIDGMIGLIVGVHHIPKPSPGEPWARLKLLVYAGTGDTPRLHAPIARAFGIDTDNNRIYVRDNWLGLSLGDGTWPGDASFFIEQEFAGVEPLGGNADIYIDQWDGNAYRPPITGLAVTGTGSDGTGTYLEVDGPITGYYHRMDSIVRFAPRGVQTAPWVLAYYGVVCEKNGTFDGGQPGFKWEDL